MSSSIHSLEVLQREWITELLSNLFARNSALRAHSAFSNGALAPHSQLHLAVMAEPHLEWLLGGCKTTESRFSKYRSVPYGIVKGGDWLLLKEISGPVVGICRARKVTFIELDESRLAQVRKRYSAALCATDPTFWHMRSRARYLTLMSIDKVRRLSPVRCSKRDRRGWVVLRSLVKSG